MTRSNAPPTTQTRTFPRRHFLSLYLAAMTLLVVAVFALHWTTNGAP